jgi:hypothetical protein
MLNLKWQCAGCYLDGPVQTSITTCVLQHVFSAHLDHDGKARPRGVRGRIQRDLSHLPLLQRKYDFLIRRVLGGKC